MLTKQAVNLNFAQGLDTKTDPKQVAFGKFLILRNSIFTKGGLLQKRNGYDLLSTIQGLTYLTTLNGNLTAVGKAIAAYNEGNKTFVSRGSIAPMQINTLPLVRNNLNQTACDSVIASNGLICTVYSEANAGVTQYKYVIADSVTGQNIIAPSLIPISSGAITQSSRVFVLGNYFMILFTNVIGGVNHLQYVAISINNPALVTPNTDITSSHISSPHLSWDAIVLNNKLFVGYNTLTGGQSIKVNYITNILTISAPITFAGSKATMMSATADVSNPSSPVIYFSFYDSVSTNGFTLAINQNLQTVFAPVQTITAMNLNNIASAAQNDSVSVFYEVNNNYGYDSAIPTHYISSVSVSNIGVVGSTFIVVRSVGLASKAFIVDETIYFLSAYQSTFQPTYFLINGSISIESMPAVVAKIAYENGGGYLPTGLPSVTVTGSTAQVPYLFKDLIQALTTNSDSQQTVSGGVYSQTGINLVSFAIGTQNIDTAEIGNDLNISGGFMWMYDGYLPVEQNFFVWPDSIEGTWSTTGGSIAAQPDGATNTDAYFTQWTYEWTDNQGNAFRSSPSIPVAITTTGSGTTGSITWKVPTLRLTYKISSPVKLVGYRWSVENQTYHQFTSITSAVLNNTSIDFVTVIDTQSDASIQGNNIIYTTGGVIEDINPPATNIMTLFDNRLWLVDAEDQNLLWFSKQVIESTPVEMSDLLTVFVAPTTAAQGSTGPMTALAPMDDKIVIFKRNAIYYINGTGPDNTGANNQYSQPIFVNSTVGCMNQQSIVFMPRGLMFQSEKGIWLLGRDLSTEYIGAPVEDFNASTVQSAVNIPETNQVRFTLNTGQTLVYDYYYDAWSTFVGVPAISSCIFQGLHTFLNQFGQVLQESPGSYQDDSRPVLMSFTTSWFQFAGLQGYMRAYFFYLLGQYFTPIKFVCQVAYNYNPAPLQTTIVKPTNFNPTYGGPETNGQDTVYGQDTPYGGETDTLDQRVFLTKQRCSSFQITIQEVYDPSFNVASGEGFSLSGINLVFGVKKGFRPISARHSAGSP